MKKLVLLLSLFMPIAIVASTFNGRIEGTTVVSSVNVQKLTNTGLDFISTAVVSPEGTFSFSDDIKSGEIYSIVMVLNNGKIEDSGTHEELLEKNKYYKKLYNLELSKNS